MVRLLSLSIPLREKTDQVEHGTAHIFGKLPSTLDGTAVPADRVVSVNDPIAIRATLAGAAKSTKFVGGAAGRSHMLLVGSDGHVYAFGNNIVGQLGIVRLGSLITTLSPAHQPLYQLQGRFASHGFAGPASRVDSCGCQILTHRHPEPK